MADHARFLVWLVYLSHLWELQASIKHFSHHSIVENVAEEPRSPQSGRDPLRILTAFLLGFNPVIPLKSQHAGIGTDIAQWRRGSIITAGLFDEMQKSPQEKADAAWKDWEEKVDRINKLKAEGNVGERRPEKDAQLTWQESLQACWKILTKFIDQEDDPSYLARYTNYTLDLFDASGKVLGTQTSEEKKALAKEASEQASKELFQESEYGNGLIWEYNAVKLKRLAKSSEGLNLGNVFNGAFILIVLRLTVPRLLAMNSMSDLGEMATSLGLPSKEEMQQYLAFADGLDYTSKLAAFTGVFVLEKLLLIGDFVPFGVVLPTISPALFGSVPAGVLATGFSTTAASSINFFLGRNLFTEKVRGFSLPDQPPLEESSWFKALYKRFDSSQFPDQFPSEGFKSSLLLRLAPLLPIPIDAHWYIAGTTPVKYSEFALAHFLGSMKAAVVDAYFGSLLLKTVTDTTELGDTKIVLIVETVFLIVISVLVTNVAVGSFTTMMADEGVDVNTFSGVPGLSPEEKAADATNLDKGEEEEESEKVFYRRS